MMPGSVKRRRTSPRQDERHLAMVSDQRSALVFVSASSPEHRLRHVDQRAPAACLPHPRLDRRPRTKFVPFRGKRTQQWWIGSVCRLQPYIGVVMLKAALVRSWLFVDVGDHVVSIAHLQLRVGERDAARHVGTHEPSSREYCEPCRPRCCSYPLPTAAGTGTAVP